MCQAPACGEAEEFALTAELESVAARTVRRASFSPCGRRLAAAAFDGTVAIYEHNAAIRPGGRIDEDDAEEVDEAAGGWRQVAVLEGHESEVKAVAWGAGGELLATCGRDKTVWVWACEEDNEFECAAVLSGHGADVKDICWHPTKEVLLSASYDNTVKVWGDPLGEDEWSCTQTLGVPEAADGSPGASVRAGGGGEEGDGVLPAGHASTVWGLAMHASGDRFVTAGDDRHVALWVQAGGSRGDAHLSGWALAASAEAVHERPIYTVDWRRGGGADGRGDLVATGGGDDAICLLQASMATDALQSEANEGSGAGIAGWLGSAFGRGNSQGGGGEAPAADSAARWSLGVASRCDKAHAGDVNCVAWRPPPPPGAPPRPAGAVALASVGDDGCLKLWAIESD